VPTGDAHTSLETSLQNFASAPFYTKWAQDIADIQGYPAHTGCGYGVCHLPEGLDDPVGYIAHTAPTIDGGGGPGWSGFICVMPWQLYLATEDLRPLQAAYPHQLKLLKFWNRAKSDSDGLIHDWSTKGGKVGHDGQSHGDSWTFLGDWLAPHGSEPSITPEAELFNNCCELRSIQISQPPPCCHAADIVASIQIPQPFACGDADCGARQTYSTARGSSPTPLSR